MEILILQDRGYRGLYQELEEEEEEEENKEENKRAKVSERFKPKRRKDIEVRRALDIVF